jgi:hypothetical protein
MALDVPVPDPPELAAVDPNEYEDADVVGDAEYRRAEIEEFLAAGAWEEAFTEWAAETSLDERAYGIVRDLALLAEFDFFWDAFAGRVGYHAPGIPEDWQERDYHPALDSWGTVSGINAALTELGQTVCDVLLAAYIEWETEYETPDDLPDFE